jgi:cytidyltransferase-like protein
MFRLPKVEEQTDNETSQWCDHSATEPSKAPCSRKVGVEAQKPTALFVGRYQPFHLGHLRLIEEGLRRVGQVCIAVRDTHGANAKNPLPFFAVKQRIEAALSAHVGRFVVVALPNITDVFYGRDVGYNVERIVLSEGIERLSGTKLRALAAGQG